MADMAKDSLKIWKALERDAGTSLRTMSGLLNFGDPSLGQGTPEGMNNMVIMDFATGSSADQARDVVGTD